MRTFLLLGAISGFLAVAFGAFGAHGLAGRISAKDLEIYNTAAHYQLAHSFALITVALASTRIGGKTLWASGWCFAFGILIFSGSLYVLAITDVKWLGAITPVGGLLLLAGWALLAASATQLPKGNL